jgi:hypothetical protein
MKLKKLISGVEGLMMDLEISPDNRFVAAYTNNNQVTSLALLIGQFYLSVVTGIQGQKLVRVKYVCICLCSVFFVFFVFGARDRCYDFFNIFAEKFSKKLAFLTQIMQNFDHNIGF